MGSARQHAARIRKARAQSFEAFRFTRLLAPLPSAANRGADVSRSLLCADERRSSSSLRSPKTRRRVLVGACRPSLSRHRHGCRGRRHILVLDRQPRRVRQTHRIANSLARANDALTRISASDSPAEVDPYPFTPASRFTAARSPLMMPAA